MENNADSVKLWRQLFQTVEAIRNYYARHIGVRRPYPEITLPQLRVLSCVILSSDEKKKAKDIAEELGISPGGISQIVESLVKMELLIRKTDESDRRAVNISLSEKGKKIQNDFDNSLSDLFSRILNPVEPEKQKIFIEVLECMNNSLEKEKKRKKIKIQEGKTNE